ncbi:MAG: DUF2249 domain-containing protein [Chloroflexi bacterium]|nr:DUF2249 domain-containing protein [Chloroflexota bacterium]
MSTTGAATTKTITPNMKIAEVLKEHPELLDVLVAQSPHFSRLKNPILRRIHGRLVTVAQAAAVAGIDPIVLVRTLNTAIGQNSTEEFRFTLPSMAVTPEPAWVKGAQIAVSLDVRDDQRNHSDPFKRIMAATSQIQEGQVFQLRNTFEPLPLYDVLGKQGFVAWARKLGTEDWEIFFLKTARTQGAKTDSGSIDQARPAEDGGIDTTAATATITIDVGELTPPQPMIKIMDALASLKHGETLLVHHQRRPAYLYPKLAELGYKHKTIEKGPNQIEIYIRKA